VLRRLMGTSAGAAASALRAASAAHGPLEAGARLFGNARARGRLSLAGMRRFGGLVKFFVGFFGSFSMKLGMFFSVLGRVFFAVALSMFGGSLGGHRLIMHFVGNSVRFRRRVLVILFLFSFAISFLIGVQRVLQFFEFGGLNVRLGHRFDGLGALFGVGLRFFVLGFG
jgi:hypothetical protein